MPATSWIALSLAFENVCEPLRLTATTRPVTSAVWQRSVPFLHRIGVRGAADRYPRPLPTRQWRAAPALGAPPATGRVWGRATGGVSGAGAGAGGGTARAAKNPREPRWTPGGGVFPRLWAPL